MMKRFGIALGALLATFGIAYALTTTQLWNGTDIVDLTHPFPVNVVSGGSGGGPVTIVDGGAVTLGSKADAKSTATDTTAVTIMSVLKQISASVQAPPSQAATQSGTWTVQPGNTANTTAWKVDGSAVTQPVSGTVTANSVATTTGGCTPYHATSAASANATLISAGAHTLCSFSIINTTGTIYYFRLYDAVGTPTCSSATGAVASYPIPASASGAGVAPPLAPFGIAFTAGLGFCLTGGGGDTDNTNAATGVYVNASYK